VTANQLRALAFGLSDVGKKRERNEDNYLICPDLSLFVVADGMGGHAGGEMASSLTVKAAAQIVQDHRDILDPNAVYDDVLESSPVAKLLSDALRGACHEVYDRSQRDSSLHGMGTTATALVLHNQSAFIAHVGDSRAYLIRHDQILQLSEDHSLVNEQLKAGLITSEQARNSRFRNIITRSIGFENDVDVDMIALEVRPRDTFLLCTDGLTTLLADQEIRDILTENYLHDVPQLLIDLANHRGGDDNITVIAVYVVSDEELNNPNFNEKRIRLAAGHDRTTTLTIASE
jgi:serine/threonine protein phosphatase PrpC